MGKLMTAIYDFKMKRIDGSSIRMDQFKGKVLLIVNVASKCGLTPQYEGLEKLYESHRAEGLEVLGFPANEFLGQEPGTNEEISGFCRSIYGIQFPMFEKIVVKGDGQHPLYHFLTEAMPIAQTTTDGSLEKRLTDKGLGRTNPQDILWNFEKFLVDRQGQVIARFAPDTAPESAELEAAIMRELIKK